MDSVEIDKACLGDLNCSAFQTWETLIWGRGEAERGGGVGGLREKRGADL